MRVRLSTSECSLLVSRFGVTWSGTYSGKPGPVPTFPRDSQVHSRLVPTYEGEGGLRDQMGRERELNDAHLEGQAPRGQL
jgi:hypothetical protein